MKLGFRRRRQSMAAIFVLLVAANIFGESSVPEAREGVMDLRSYDFAQDGPVVLAGEWAFYWNTLVDAENFREVVGGEPDHFIRVPSYWDDLADIDPRVSPRGVATYALRILADPGVEPRALKFLNITPNADIHLNGVRISQLGHVDADPERSRSGNRIQVIPVPSEKDELVLTVSISNYHNVNGGLNRPIQFGRFDQIMRSRVQGLAIEAVLMGGLLLMGLYQITLFLLDRKRRAPLFMAALCLLAFAFSGFKNEMVLLTIVPAWGGEIRTKFIFIALTLATPAFALYAYNLYPAYVRKWFNWAVVPPALVFAVLVLMTPKAFYTRFLLVMEALLFATAVGNITMLVIGYLKTRDQRVMYYLGGLLFLIASILFSVLDNEFAVVFQSAAGVFFVFILYQAFLQAYIYSHAFREIDHLARQKSNLEKRNVELFSLSYIDSLTGICNRRLLDDYLASNWRVNSFSERSLGMILIDIDDFKMYNDYFGHRQGDVCLTKVCEVIQRTLEELGEDTLARYGGEEFAVIVSDTDEMTLFRYAETIRLAVESAGIDHPASRAAGVVTISLGCACLVPSIDSDPETLLDEADRALYRAKAAGRNRSILGGSPDAAVSWGPRSV